MSRSLEERLADCERANARQQKLVVVQALFWPILCSLLFAGAAMANRATPLVQSLKVREIAVVDGAGVVRARLGGDLPDARYPDGRLSKRDKTAGLLIYDEQGIERGGYVTQAPESNAMLTLDSKNRQSLFLIAAPSQDQVSALKLWRPDSSIELRSDEAGSRLSVNDKSGVILQQPALSALPVGLCRHFSDLEKKYPNERICQSKFGETACRQCL